MGAETYIYLSKDRSSFVARVNGNSTVKLDEVIKIALDEDKIHIFDKESEITIL